MPVRKRVFRYDRKKDKVVEVKQPKKVRLRPQWPLRSDAFSVSPDQVEEANHTMESLGLKPNFVRSGEDAGCYEFESRKHRKETGEHPDIEFYDRSSYGGMDPQQPHRKGYEPPEEPKSSFFGL
tara:strand:- start:285 stop:656 length:372 start_codon:yes stop_codon:yes gene_type:complete